ncbi:MAG: adenylate/guanylate cyclase domain-containing protein [Alphaproteobacteria bacterium]|nr:adenylate/guanylate cyclase domain-containing protein [Alphaproteobacteria bacterium]
MSGIRTVIDWLTDGARSGTASEDVLEELCRRMIGAGIPLWRAAVFVNTLHPDVIGRAFIWQVDTGVKISSAKYDILETEEYRTSPVVAVYGTRKPLRRHLADGDCPDDFPIVHELRAEGATDYAAMPMLFTDGTVHVATWTTQQPGGYTPQQYADIESIMAPLTRVAEIRALRRTATNLLNTYVGREAGERILMGKIRRGFVEEIRAIIWLSDMRGFTSLAERLPPQQLVDLLNRYFDCQVPPIVKHGGEVLKFMGDGLLAIFPLTGGNGETCGICERALACAREAQALIQALGTPPGASGHDAIRFGLALHIGQVMYGNIGGGNRLDFTCIGPAVNLAARLEKTAGQLGQSIVASAEFAAQLPAEFTRLGECKVAGFSAPQALFGLTVRVDRNDKSAGLA